MGNNSSKQENDVSLSQKEGPLSPEDIFKLPETSAKTKHHTLHNRVTTLASRLKKNARREKKPSAQVDDDALVPIPMCYLGSRNNKPILVVFAPVQDQDHDPNRPFRFVLRNTDREERLKYLDHTPRPSTAVWRHMTRREYDLVFFRKCRGDNLLLAEIGNSTYVVKTGPDASKLRDEAVALLEVFFGLHSLWPRENAVRASLGYDVPRVPLPIMMLPSVGRMARRRTGLLMEFTPTLSEFFRQDLVRRHLGHGMLQTLRSGIDWRAMTIHPYMGMLQPRSINFGPEGLAACPAYLDMLYKQSPRRIALWAVIMGRALAVLHWQCNLDGAGVEFYFAEGYRGYAQLSLTGVHRCGKFVATCKMDDAGLLSAVTENPQWPRPKRAPSFRNVLDRGQTIAQMWHKFGEAYIGAGERILFLKGEKLLRHLPHVFIANLEKHWEQAPPLALPSK